MTCRIRKIKIKMKRIKPIKDEKKLIREMIIGVFKIFNDYKQVCIRKKKNFGSLD